MRMLFLPAALLIAATSTPSVARDSATAEAGATVTVTFVGVQTHSGAVMVALYDADGWKAGKPVRVAVVDATAALPTASMSGLAPGRYAIKAFHDVDGDGKMGANPFGVPTEPFAFSNDAKGTRGPATWEDASFEVGPGTSQQRITIR